MKYTDILLDLDDTLIDTAKNTRITVNEIYNDYHLDVYFDSFPAFFSFYHTNVSKLWDMYNKGQIAKEGIQIERFAVSLRNTTPLSEDEIRIINEDYIQRIMLKSNLIEGAIEILGYLKPKYKIHILSNGFTEMQYTKMESANIPQTYFENIILSDVVGVNKPHPDIFKYALDIIKSDPRKVIMIGDNLQTDIYGAYNGGIDQIWFNPENKSSEDIKPTYTVNTLAEIKGLL